MIENPCFWKQSHINPGFVREILWGILLSLYYAPGLDGGNTNGTVVIGNGVQFSF